MYYCYCCNIILKKKKDTSKKELKNGQYRSLEHVIPNFLGPKLNSYKLLCSNCNSDLGSSLDGALSEDLIFYRLIDFKTDRKGNKRKVTGEIEGEQIVLLIDKKRFGHFFKPQIIFDKEGKVDKVAAVDEKQAYSVLRAYGKDNPDFDIEAFIKKSKFEWFKVDKGYRIDFSNHTISKEETLRGIAKIALNYYLSLKYDKEYVQEMIDYVCANIRPREFTRMYYPLVPIVLPNENEVSNTLYLKGDVKRNLLYCYVDLFNITKFLVMMNNRYDGTDFENCYSWDVLGGTERKKNLKFTLLFHPFRTKVNKDHIQEQFKYSFDRFLRIVEKVGSPKKESPASSTT